jgi:type VI secretion system secreted protein VgrG
MTPVTFTLQVDGLDSDAIRVVRLDGEERLTRPYRFDVDVVSSNANLAVETLLARTATLTLARGSSSRNIHGVIFEASEAGQAPGDVYAYRFQLVPRISLLALSHHNRSFGTQTAQSVLDVIQSVLSDPSGIGLGQSDWSISVLKPESYPKRDFWAQYDESDFDFVHRLLEHWGSITSSIRPIRMKPSSSRIRRRWPRRRRSTERWSMTDIMMRRAMAVVLSSP